MFNGKVIFSDWINASNILFLLFIDMWKSKTISFQLHKESWLWKTSTITRNVDLASLKLDFSELNIENLKTVSTNLKMLISSSSPVDLKKIKKSSYRKLVSQVSGIKTKVPSTPTSIHKSQYDTDKQNFRKKIEDVDSKINNVRGL